MEIATHDDHTLRQLYVVLLQLHRRQLAHRVYGDEGEGQTQGVAC